MAQFMSKALRMASECFLHHSAPSLCYTLYTEMTGDGLVLEGLSQPASALCSRWLQSRFGVFCMALLPV